MAQSWDDIKTRASAFATEFKDATDEKSQAQTFWLKFFAVFGVDSHRVGVFESRVKKLNKHVGFADYFWPGLLLIEHKSAGENLDIAQTQAENYCINLKEEEHPRYLLVCDFQRFWLKDLTEGTEARFSLAELPQKVSLFGFIFGRKSARIQASDPINDRAVHMAWMRATCGRLESRYRYSANIVYNNFPWPQAISDKARQGIEAAAQAVLDSRANPASLATLYDPDLMPADLRKAHTALDTLVDKLYFDQSKAKIKPTDQSRVALLFERYQALVESVSPKTKSDDTP